MKNKFLKTLGVLLVTLIMVAPIAAEAATKNFSFDIKHQLSIGSYTSTKGSVKATVNMSAWGGDNYFTIHIYKKNYFGSTLVTRLGFSKSSAGSPYVSETSAVTKGEKYGYEIWKNQNGKRIKGTGTLDY
ncbi:hypothetical protein ACK2WG_16980 [Bacillus spizizenii]|uniref:hypothetical protein n=1 Tax=Bacillus spizizenii TaxID=96241 RepID=UPI00391838EB